MDDQLAVSEGLDFVARFDRDAGLLHGGDGIRRAAAHRLDVTVGCDDAELTGGERDGDEQNEEEGSRAGGLQAKAAAPG